MVDCLVAILPNYKISVGFERKSAIEGEGESPVKIWHCPATVIDLLAAISRVRMPADS